MPEKMRGFMGCSFGGGNLSVYSDRIDAWKPTLGPKPDLSEKSGTASQFASGEVLFFWDHDGGRIGGSPHFSLVTGSKVEAKGRGEAGLVVRMKVSTACCAPTDLPGHPTI